MSTINPYGIFASTINGKVSLGANVVKGWSLEKCKRVYRACVAVLPPEEIEFVRESFSTRYNGSTQSSLEQAMSLLNITAAQAWCDRMLQSVQSEHSTKSVIHGSEENQTIHDCRTADKVLAQCINA
jgi:hypothetical protein